jgi:hypothetical protein
MDRLFGGHQLGPVLLLEKRLLVLLLPCKERMGRLENTSTFFVVSKKNTYPR